MARNVSETISFFLVGVGIVLVLLAGAIELVRAAEQRVVDRHRTRIETIAREQSIPVHIRAGSLIDRGIEPTTIAPPYWGIAKEQVSYLLDSARLGDAGNVVLYGHNAPTILGKLHELSIGSELHLTGATGHLYTYRVRDAFETTASDTSILADTDSPILTIYTCSGIFDTKRFVVIAEFVRVQ